MPAGSILLAALGLGYLCGSIPFGLLLTRAAGLGDVRAIGSGNIGATNVLRTGRKGLAAATLLLDGLKGAIPVALATRWLGPEAGLAVATGALLGHCFPVWLGFRGGKGVATFVGCLSVIDVWTFLAFAASWVAVATATRYSSLSSLVATIVAALVPFWSGERATGLVCLGLAAVIWLQHRANIGRLLAGEEGRIGRTG